MNNDIDVLHELDVMKSQMALLKKILDGQRIVNERHLRNAIKGGISSLNRHAVKMCIIGIVALVLCTASFLQCGFSKAFIAFTALMILFCVCATYMQHRNLIVAKGYDSDLVSATFDLVRLKKRYSQWLWIALPMIMLWGTGLIYECLYSFTDKEMAIPFMSGSFVGLVTGGIIGIRIHIRTLRKIEKLLAQIKELKECMALFILSVLVSAII